jgi:hypothetical protein
MKNLLTHLFAGSRFKGSLHYLKNQRVYELIRTCLYFAISLALYASGVFTTGSNKNLLTIVAVLGMLPASKSLVETVMFFRFRGCSEELSERIEKLELPEDLCTAYDRVFTSSKKDHNISHMAIRGGAVCGISEDPKFDENEFREHLTGQLKAEGFQGFTVKIFTDPGKYEARLLQMKEQEDDDKSRRMMQTILQISL